ncbi:MAG: DUF433 domain-containing protein [Candidatus Kapaibacterium sp.]
MITQSHYIISDPDILGGTPVFTGSRVPFSYLMEYLERGSNIEQFVADYPSITSQLATKALEEASSVVDEFVHARPA